MDLNTTSEEMAIKEERLTGIEGLAFAVIDRAIKDLESNKYHSASAIYFFKNSQKLLEFWLCSASHLAKHPLNIEVAKEKLYAKAEQAEQRRILLLKQAKQKQR